LETQRLLSKFAAQQLNAIIHQQRRYFAKFILLIAKTYNRCGKQYVVQSLSSVKDRFLPQVRSIEREDERTIILKKISNFIKMPIEVCKQSLSPQSEDELYPPGEGPSLPGH